MPKISELPSASELSGGETVAVVQNGVTRQLSIANLLSAPRQAIVENVRWLTTTETGNTYLNSLELLIEVH